jgi:hypothetical protein
MYCRCGGSVVCAVKKEGGGLPFIHYTSTLTFASVVISYVYTAGLISTDAFDDTVAYRRKLGR